MKRTLLLLFTFSIIQSAFSQSPKEVEAMADEAVASFTWDVEKTDKGTLLFLDVPYLKENSDKTEYLTLTVAKSKSEKRPAFISVIIPNNIVQSNGIFIAFANTVSTKEGGRKIQIDNESTKRINFENCNDADCTARVIGGYLTDEKTNKKIDIFQNFLKYDHALFLFVYPDGSHKSVSVPLFSFQKQYKKLQ